jgi:hypothetical protein
MQTTAIMIPRGLHDPGYPQTAPPDADPTRRVYFASTPRV